MKHDSERTVFERIFDLSTFSLPALVTAALLSGCGPKADTPLETSVPDIEGGRITVERVGVFQDALAYDGSRGIYIIRDKETGQEYIGVSGIGIAERGSHHSGKVTASDER